MVRSIFEEFEEKKSLVFLCREKRQPTVKLCRSKWDRGEGWMASGCSLVQWKKLLATNEANMSQVQKSLQTQSSSCDEIQACGNLWQFLRVQGQTNKTLKERFMFSPVLLLCFSTLRLSVCSGKIVVLLYSQKDFGDKNSADSLVLQTNVGCAAPSAVCGTPRLYLD